MNQECNQEGVLKTPLRKALVTVYTESGDEKELRKFESEKILGMATTVAEWKINRRIQFSQPKDATSQQQNVVTKKVNKVSTNPQKRDTNYLNVEKQTSVQEVYEYTFRLINMFYSDSYFSQDNHIKAENRLKLQRLNNSFRVSIIKILKSFKQKPKQLSTHLNKIFYCAPNIRILSYAQIQKQILSEWKQNILLASIRTQWYTHIQKFLPQFEENAESIFRQIICQQFCQFLSHLTYFIFKQYFRLQVEKKRKTKEMIKIKLAKQTMRYIITQTLQWSKFVYLSIEHIILSQSSNFIKSIQGSQKGIFTQGIIQQMKIKQMKKLLQQQYKQNKYLFIQTAHAINKFNKQHQMYVKIKNIVNVRVALEQDILTYQKILIEKQEISDFRMFEKDQILTCIILAILSNNISFQALTISLKEVRMILGEQTEKTLGLFKCPSYFTDLQAALDFLKLQMKGLSTIQENIS